MTITLTLKSSPSAPALTEQVTLKYRHNSNSQAQQGHWLSTDELIARPRTSQHLSDMGENAYGEWGVAAAGVIVLNPHNPSEIALFKRADGTHDSALWSFPGGALKTDENGALQDPLDCALQEIEEETGRIPKGAIWSTPIDICNKDTGYIYHAFLLVHDARRSFCPRQNGGEHTEWQWANINEIQTMADVHPGVFAILERANTQWQGLTPNDFVPPLQWPENIAQPDNIWRSNPAEHLAIKLSKVAPSDLAQLEQAPLTHAQRSLLKDADSPTILWLDHIGDKFPWTQSDIECLPLKLSDLINVEKHLCKSHVFAYHAMKEELIVIQWTAKALMNVIRTKHDPSNTLFLSNTHCLRNPFSHMFHRYSSVNEIRNALLNNAAGDNGRLGTGHLLSCTPSLFHNTNHDAMECAADYLFNGTNVQPPNILDELKALITQQNIPKLTQSKINEYAKKILMIFNDQVKELPEHLSEKPGSTLLQIAIPHHLVNTLCYISKENGRPDPQAADALTKTLEWKNKSLITETIEDKSRSQMRLFIDALQVPELSAVTTINYYGRIPDNTQAHIKDEISNIINELIEK